MDAYFFGQRKAVPAAFEEWLTPQLAAAVSIDMHRGHLDDSPECPCPAPRAREIIEPINAFHHECRRLGVPVIHVKTGLRASGVDADADMVSLAQTNAWLIAWWLVNVVVFLVTLAGGGGTIFLTGPPLLAILAAIVLAGIIPLIMHALRPVGSKDTLAFAAALVLVGGFLMRFGIVMGPQIH